jgi:hypothetical protein
MGACTEELRCLPGSKKGGGFSCELRPDRIPANQLEPHISS